MYGLKMPSISSYKLKSLLGIKLDDKTKIKTKDISDLVAKNKIAIENKIKKDERNQIDPNVIILLKRGGFDLEQFSVKNSMNGTSYYYDICNDDIKIHTNYPIQVYYTNLIIEELSKNDYFKNNYMEDIFVNKDLFKIEEEVLNLSANYAQQKYLDISIHSKENYRHLISIEINEYEHRSKQTEDEKRSDDLRSRKNVQGYTIYGPFVLKLNKKGEVSDEEFKRFINDILSWIQKINILNENEDKQEERKKEFVVEYMMNKEVGKKAFCELIYNSWKDQKNFLISLDGILDFFGKTYLKKNIDFGKEFIKYQADIDTRINIELKENTDNKIKNKNYKKIDNEIILNFNGLSEFFQFLHLHQEYFKSINTYNKITVFMQNTINCMMSALSDLNDLGMQYYKDFMISRNTKFHYGSY
jgi:hypothetical protein